MFLNKLIPEFNPVILMPESLQFITLLVAINFVLDGLTCLLIHLDDFRPDHLIDVIGWQLIN